ncbi:MAG: type II secretion system F family protein [Bryobacteraceae bacterium]
MTQFWILFGVLWLAAIGAWWMASRTMRRADLSRIRGRLSGNASSKESKRPGTPAPVLIPDEAKHKGTIILHLLGRVRLTERLQVLLEQADLKWDVARFVYACLALALAGFAVGGLVIQVGHGVLSIVFAAAAGVLPVLWVVRKKSARLRRFEEQFPDSLEFVARSMRAGHAFSVSLEMLHKEFEDPLSSEFRRTFEEHNLGLPLDAALQKLAQRVPLMDVHFFVSAVLLQKRTGGNLAELLDKLAHVIRERFKLRGRIRAVSAHGKMTGAALSTIPIMVAGLMFFVNREYVTFFFTDPTGQWMAGSAVALQIVGYGFIRKIVSIEV